MQSGGLDGWILGLAGGKRVLSCERLQTLWGGCGELLRVHLEGAPSVILKRIVPPVGGSFSDERKRRSYEVERAWYQGPSRRSQARLAACLGVNGSLLLLEDLRNAGFQQGRPALEAGLRWLAAFHLSFLDDVPAGLWEQGTYWHLATRPDEWQRMPSGPLKELASAVDRKLRATRHVTVVHGDAKPANFLWSREGAAAVDFQYVGAGCGMRDVSYLLDCCVGEGLELELERWLDFYFAALGRPDVEQDWRPLFPFAWCDFCRFEQGWRGPSPLGPFSQRMLRSVLDILQP